MCVLLCEPIQELCGRGHKEFSEWWTAHIAPCVTVWWAEDVCSHRQESHIKTGIRNCYFVTAWISAGFYRVLAAASALGLSAACPSHCINYNHYTVTYSTLKKRCGPPRMKKLWFLSSSTNFFTSSNSFLQMKSYLSNNGMWAISVDVDVCGLGSSG